MLPLVGLNFNPLPSRKFVDNAAKSEMAIYKVKLHAQNVFLKGF